MTPFLVRRLPICMVPGISTLSPEGRSGPPKTHDFMRPVPMDEDMNAEAAAILEALLALPSNPTSKAIAHKAGLGLDETEDLLAALVVVGFVDTASVGRWRAHDLLRHEANRQTLGMLLALLRGRLIEQTSAQADAEPPPPPPPAPPPPKLLQLSAAAHRLGVHPDTLDVWAKQQLVPFTWTAGGRRRFDVEAIRAALARDAA